MIRRPQGNISPLWLIVILLAFIAILYQTNYMYATIEKRVKSWLQLEDVSLAEGISRLYSMKTDIFQNAFFLCFFIRNDLSRVDLIIKVVFKFLSDL